MHIDLMKQPKKYLSKCTQNDYAKIKKALDGLENLQGDIKKLQGRSDEYRLKIPPFRVIFTYDKATKIITINKIDVRGGAYKK